MDNCFRSICVRFNSELNVCVRFQPFTFILSTFVLFHCRFPFEENSYIKYFGKWICLTLAIDTYGLIAIASFLLLIGTCLSCEACIEELIHKVEHSMDSFVNNTEYGYSFEKVFGEARLGFIETIKFHSHCIGYGYHRITSSECCEK